MYKNYFRRDREFRRKLRELESMKLDLGQVREDKYNDLTKGLYRNSVRGKRVRANKVY